ncbi:BRO domain-containing protein [Cereibacter sphaeroides WS8N]|uniref:BRO-N domain-containing protein n=1 Tax=Cereibacter sphaeroides TaxID=1063 RepID=UPI00020B00FF|nr:BRO family protein [Cereibacter sphaeroides]EGJ19713.1 BRO domain-containing protein [Cereibacter sphaeroides WS8N]
MRVVEIEGNPWFAVADVCKALDIAQTPHAVANIGISNVKRAPIVGQRGRPMVLISEAGLYDLVFNSRKPEAEAFKSWVTGTVLPAIRKDGGYIMGEEKVVTGEGSEYFTAQV